VDEKVAEALRKVYLGTQTGVLLCESAEFKRGIFFKSGFAVGARSSQPDDRLGEVLIRHSRITKQQFEDASHFIKSGWKLGEILAELGVLEKEEIEKFIRIQLLEIACGALFNLPQKMTFSELSSVDAVVATPLSVADILMEAARKTPAIEPHKRKLLADERRIGFSPDPLLRFQDVRLTPEEAFILSRVDGEQAIRAMFTVSPLPEEQTARTLLGLLRAGIIEPEGEGRREKEPPVEEPAKPAPRTESAVDSAKLEIDNVFNEFRSKDPWQVLSLERSARSEEIRHAFQDKARFYHPDRYRHITDPSVQEKLSYLFHRIREAFEILSIQTKTEKYQKLAEKEAQYEEKQKSWSGPSRKDTPSKNDALSKEKTQEKVSQLERSRHPNEAKELFQRAKQAYQQDDYWNVIQLCQQAIEIISDQSEYYHLLGLALSKNPKWRQDAEKNLNIAAKLDPWKSAYLGSLGKLYLDAGMHMRAQKIFEQARAIDPSFHVPED
jgi:curved DNA-binding protein CbpA